MTLRTRIYIAVGFIITFLIVAPPLVLYTSGYRYDWNKRAWFNPGWLILESTPKGASILLNGRDTGMKTPTTIKNLNPDEYVVTTQLAGYHGWEKRLSVTAGLATFAEDIRLFKVGQPRKIDERPWNSSFISPNQEHVMMTNESAGRTELAVLRLESGKVEQLHDGTEKIKEILWTPSSDAALIFFSDNSLARWEPRRSGFDILETQLPANKVTRWRLVSPNELWGLAGDKIVKFKLSDGVIEEEFLPGCPARLGDCQSQDNFALINGRVYLLDYLAGSPSTSLSVLSQNGKIQITRLPKAHYEFIPGGKNLVTLIEKENNQLYVIEPGRDDKLVLPDFIATAGGASWDKDGERLLFGTPSDLSPAEIWIWDAATGQKTLVTRSSGFIVSTQWHPQGQHVLIVRRGETQSGEISIIELDERDKKNIAPLAAGDIPKNIFFSPDGNKIYLLIDETGGPRLFSQDI